MFKAIGRGLKKIGRAIRKHAKFFVKKILPIALLAATAYFTFGASLGFSGAATGWSAKVGALVSKLGITGKMGGIMASSIVQAGRGALVGGLMGAVTGGGKGFVKGAQIGAATGAIMGGVQGAFKPGLMPAGKDLSGNVIQSGKSEMMLGKSASEAIKGAGDPVGVVPGSGSRIGKVWDKVVGSGGIGPILKGVGSGIGRGLEQKAVDRRIEERQQSYNIDYKPIEPMFTRTGQSILARDFGGP